MACREKSIFKDGQFSLVVGFKKSERDILM